MIGLALALASAPPNESPVEAYMHCVRRMAVRLEPSGDSPENVASAAKVYCTPSRTAAINSARDLKGSSDASVSEIESAADLYARAQAVVARLCRRTHDCELNHVP